MRTSLLSALAALAVPVMLAAEAANTVSAEEKAAGFTLLFDGTAATGWRGYRQKTLPSAWTVVDGTLGLSGGNGEPSTG